MLEIGQVLQLSTARMCNIIIYSYLLCIVCAFSVSFKYRDEYATMHRKYAENELREMLSDLITLFKISVIVVIKYVVDCKLSITNDILHKI